MGRHPEPANALAGNAGTPRDYSEDLYRFYLEVEDPIGAVHAILSECLGSDHAASLSAMADGYELDMPIQAAPEVVRALSRVDIAIYQLVRIGRVAGEWGHPKAR